LTVYLYIRFVQPIEPHFPLNHFDARYINKTYRAKKIIDFFGWSTR